MTIAMVIFALGMAMMTSRNVWIFYNGALLAIVGMLTMVALLVTRAVI